MHPQAARWLAVAGFIVWLAGIALWGVSWIASLAVSIIGGGMLTYGLASMKQGPEGTHQPSWSVVLPVAIALVLISQGIGWPEPVVRVALVGLGTLVMLLVLMHILDERMRVERRLAERTLVDERRQLAREVHDVVGHTLAASMLHTTAARLSVRSDPGAAIASLERAEQQGRRSIDDIQSVVRLLRDDSGAEGSVHAAVELPALVEGFRSAGADVSLASSGELGNLPALAALTVHRVVQEGLTNPARHGAGQIQVTLARSGESRWVEVDVANDRAAGGPAAQAGSGLVGMRERVHAVGGTLEAGPTGDGRRWLVRARIPA